MAKVLIVYYSRTGNTRQMAKLVAEGIRAEGIEVETKDVDRDFPYQLVVKANPAPSLPLGVRIIPLSLPVNHLLESRKPSPTVHGPARSTRPHFRALSPSHSA
jgi:hypothetical protein